jgi:hypothetical protein
LRAAQTAQIKHDFVAAIRDIGPFSEPGHAAISSLDRMV